ncbi:GIY-YIG nuclease family protein [Candidatus Woesebacteria bacterium]|jgi:putative endonuclease|nr:GIY-YIG nuclease family protein [Candidatus Woesebacteria bacterium]MDQ5951706.1 putative endonuclease [Patescibacteria group bacterium]QQR64047.1 MAG: GIY-YIG nuclease family protein [Candidatus Roizmanbacteria bacterium]
MWFVYVLQGVKSKTFYKGLTNDLDRRIAQHFLGRNQTTRKMLPVRLLHVEFCSSRLEARNLEKFYKSGFGREVLKEIADSL